MALHGNYWTCGKFADWLRGTPKGGAKSSEDWDAWTTTAQKAHPVRYWLADDALDYLQDFVTWPTRKLYDIKYYINNRYISRTNSLTAHRRDIEPGQWQDVGNRFLPCLFNELVDFVEIETASHHIAWNDDARTEFNAPFYASGWFRWKVWRCPKAGIAHLNWASSLTVGDDWGIKPGDKHYGKPTHQALAAKEILELYNWWTSVRQARVDPSDASGWSAICDKKREDNDGRLRFGQPKTAAERKETKKALDLMQKIEKQHNDEDEKMMIRLIKIRDSLWT